VLQIERKLINSRTITDFNVLYHNLYEAVSLHCLSESAFVVTRIVRVLTCFAATH